MMTEPFEAVTLAGGLALLIAVVFYVMARSVSYPSEICPLLARARERLRHRSALSEFDPALHDQDQDDHA